jgi:hypothetical protein
MFLTTLLLWEGLAFKFGIALGVELVDILQLLL